LLRQQEIYTKKRNVLSESGICAPFTGYEAMGVKKGPLISRGLLILLLCVLCLDSTQTLWEQTKQDTGRELIDMSIEELMEVPVICDSDSILNPFTETKVRGIGCA